MATTPGYQFSYSNGGSFCDYGPGHNQTLNQLYAAQQTVGQLQIGPKLYTIDFNTKRQIDANDPKRWRHIKWSPFGSQSHAQYESESDSDEAAPSPGSASSDDPDWYSKYLNDFYAKYQRDWEQAKVQAANDSKLLQLNFARTAPAVSWCQVAFPYRAQADDQMTLTVPEEIEVVYDPQTEPFWLGRKCGPSKEVGRFPRECVRPLDGPPDPRATQRGATTYKAIRNSNMSGRGFLTYQKGAIIKAVGKARSDMWEGHLVSAPGVVGLFASSTVEEYHGTSVDSGSSDEESDDSDEEEPKKAVLIATYPGKEVGGIKVREGKEVTIVEVHDEWTKVSYQGKEGFVPTSFLKMR